MVECALERMRHWRGGETRNIAEEMMKLTLEVAVRTLFGTALAGDSEAIGKAMTFLMRYYLRRGRSPWRVPASWPTPANRRARREVEFMDSLIYGIISDRKKDTRPRHDLLSMLMAAMPENGRQMTQKQGPAESMHPFVPRPQLHPPP